MLRQGVWQSVISFIGRVYRAAWKCAVWWARYQACLLLHYENDICLVWYCLNPVSTNNEPPHCAWQLLVGHLFCEPFLSTNVLNKLLPEKEGIWVADIQPSSFDSRSWLYCVPIELLPDGLKRGKNSCVHQRILSCCMHPESFVQGMVWC